MTYNKRHNRGFYTAIKGITVYVVIFAVVLFLRNSRVSPRKNFHLKYMDIYSNENITKIVKLNHREFPHLVQNRENICTRNIWRIEYHRLAWHGTVGYMIHHWNLMNGYWMFWIDSLSFVVSNEPFLWFLMGGFSVILLHFPPFCHRKPFVFVDVLNKEYYRFVSKDD